MRHFRMFQPLYKISKTSFLTPNQLRIHQTLQHINHKPTKSRYRIPTKIITSTQRKTKKLLLDNNLFRLKG